MRAGIQCQSVASVYVNGGAGHKDSGAGQCYLYHSAVTSAPTPHRYPDIYTHLDTVSGKSWYRELEDYNQAAFHTPSADKVSLGLVGGAGGGAGAGANIQGCLMTFSGGWPGPRRAPGPRSPPRRAAAAARTVSRGCAGR